jgi:hypothetical protein
MNTHRTRILLQALRLELQEKLPDDDDHSRINAFLENQYRDLCAVLAHAEDDFSVVLSLIEQDPECRDHNPHRRLNALIDYLDIAVAIYDTTGNAPHPGDFN